MHTHLEESLQRDIDRIRDNIMKMAECTESALRDCMKAYLENDHTLAYAIILRDQYIDEKEKAIDRLCLEFIVKQQPVGAALRFAYSTIKLNMEIERVGDYAESIARNLFKIQTLPENVCKNGIVQLADLSIGMFHDAIQSFIKQSPKLAHQTIGVDETVDALRTQLINRVVAFTKNQAPPLHLLDIIRRFERVADQARNICMDVLYMCTGEYVKHPGSETFRVLFVDDNNSRQSQIVEAIANGLKQSRFIFSSAGIDPQPIDPVTINFMKKKGYDISRVAPWTLDKVPNLEYYQVIVALSPQVNKMFPQRPRKTIVIDWIVEDPLTMNADAKTIEDAYEKVFNYLKKQVTDLVDAIVRNEQN